MTAPDAIERLRDYLKGSEIQEGVNDNLLLVVRQADARAILDHITALTAERDAAVSELRGIARSTGCVDACPCWAKLRRKAQQAITAGAHKRWPLQHKV